MPISRSYHPSLGVSLVEVLVTLVLIAALGALYLRSITELQRVGSLTRASSMLVSGIHDAHRRAIDHGVPYLVAVTATGWRTTHEEPSGEELIVREDRFEPGVIGVGAPVELRCFPGGTVSPRTITLQRGSARSRVTVSLRGRVTVAIE